MYLYSSITLSTSLYSMDESYVEAMDVVVNQEEDKFPSLRYDLIALFCRDKRMEADKATSGIMYNFWPKVIKHNKV